MNKDTFDVRVNPPVRFLWLIGAQVVGIAQLLTFPGGY